MVLFSRIMIEQLLEIGTRISITSIQPGNIPLVKETQELVRIELMETMGLT